MFVIYGNRRINLLSLQQYKPVDKSSNYDIELIYLDGSKEELHFFGKKEERDGFIEKLDKNVKE